MRARARKQAPPPPPPKPSFVPVYYAHETNYCPGCGRSQWLVGRLLAECAFCGTAMQITGGAMTGAAPVRRAR